MPRVLRVDDVQPGDVLLCRSNDLGGEVADATGSKYVHAAICTRPGKAAEASGLRVKEVEIESLIDSYSHIAVFHQPDWWPQQRVERLQRFVEEAISRKAKFNCAGLKNFEEQKKLHDENLNNKLHDFFEGKVSGPPAERNSYFCSELVVAAHVAVGILAPSAAVAYDPSVQSPAGLAETATFGFFSGYLYPYPEYQLPGDDEFRHESTVDEIFGEET